MFAAGWAANPSLALLALSSVLLLCVFCGLTFPSFTS